MTGVCKFKNYTQFCYPLFYTILNFLVNNITLKKIFWGKMLFKRDKSEFPIKYTPVNYEVILVNIADN